MNKFLTIATSTTLIIGAFLITGCSSSDDGGGTTATIIDANNAEKMVEAISTSLSTFEQALAVETTPVMGLKAALEIVEPLIKDRLNTSGIDLATGAAFSVTITCSGGGTLTVSGDETDDGITFSETSTATFSNCVESSLTINGTVTGSFTENTSTSEYSDNITGSLSITVVTSSDNLAISFSGINFQETGNTFASTYTTTQSAFTLVVVDNGITEVSIQATLSAPVVESNGDSCPESGHIFITGGNNTTAEGIYNGDGTMTIKANGVVVNATAPCYN